MRGALVLVVATALTVSLAAQQGPDRSKAPVPGPAPVLKLPPIQKRALANGLPVWIVEMHEVPLVNLVLVIKAGAAADPVGKYGVANFTAAMLDEGAGSKNALDLADAIEFPSFVPESMNLLKLFVALQRQRSCDQVIMRAWHGGGTQWHCVTRWLSAPT